MRGVTYNATIQLPKDCEYRLKKLNMKNLIENIDKIIIDNYFIDPKMNNMKIFNLMNRPKFVNTFLKERVFINKIILDKQN